LVLVYSTNHEAPHYVTSPASCYFLFFSEPIVLRTSFSENHSSCSSRERKR